MQSPQSTRGFATWLALFALGLQIFVSFGHLHLDGIAGTDRAGRALAAAGHASQSLLPPHPGAGDDDDDVYCPICASVSLTANSFVPGGPVLRPPSVSCTVEHHNSSVRFFIAQRRLAFQSRAPPLA